MKWEKLDERFELYLRDESRLLGQGDEISFPSSEEELRQALSDCVSAGVPVTLQGARTGIAGAGVPRAGRLISMERMDHCEVKDGRAYVQCGARLSEIKAAARSAGLRFAPNPTEESATAGGMLACAAVGPNGLRTSDCVEGAVLLLPGGERWDIRRGQYRFDRSGCDLPGGRRLELTVPLPSRQEARWGFAPCAGMDLLDLFSGSEGILAAAAELQLRLTARPGQNWGVLFFFEHEARALDFSCGLAGRESLKGSLTVEEYLDGETLELIAALSQTSSQLAALPALPARRGAAVYLELEAEGMMPPQAELMECLSCFEQCGGKDSDTWAALGERELERLRLLRHAAAEAVNVRLDVCRRELPGMTKQCGAFRVPAERLAETAGQYRKDMDRAGLQGAVFGHMLAGRLHVNLLPRTEEQAAAGRGLLDGWAEQAAALGGCALAENGVGKTRSAELLRWAPPEQLALMREIKNWFDPAGLLNRGNLFI